MGDLETGPKWWVRYAVVPLLASGGLVAIIIASVGSLENRVSKPVESKSINAGPSNAGSSSIESAKPTEGTRPVARATTPVAKVPRGARTARTADFVSAVKATGPLAYYRLQAIGGNSEVGETSYSSEGRGMSSGPGAPTGESRNRCIQLDGRSGWISTTQKGGLANAGSMMAWVDLAVLPSNAGSILYIAGEPQYGNDFDMQFEPDNTVRFYTAAGTHLTYAPETSSLVHRWHLIVATTDMISHKRAIYWDGVQVVHDRDAGEKKKTEAFTIGASPRFGGRYFDGGIEEVALWDRALNPAEVAAIYQSAASIETSKTR
jgi:hypothetical protein